MTTLQKYLLHNQIDDNSFNNEKTKEYLIQKMTGGQCCTGNSVFKHTLQKYNENQKTLYGTVLQGGRVTMPSQYFGARNSMYKPKVSFTKTSTMTPVLAKQALYVTQFGGGSKIKEVESFLKKSLHKNDHAELLKMYHLNLNEFIKNVNTISGRKITKTSVNQALAKLKI